MSKAVKSTDLSTQFTHFTLTEFNQDVEERRTFTLPCRDLIVGRTKDADITVRCKSVSKRHAKITFDGEQMIVTDLGSTNGSFHNGEAITSVVAAEGDLLQFANALYRVGKSGTMLQDATIEEGVMPFAQTLILFDRMINERLVTPHFQPIVAMDQNKVRGYEVLARSDLDGLKNPATMFGTAERLGQQAMLSELMREEGLRVASELPFGDADIYLNTHPAEVVNERLMDALKDLRNQFPLANISLEIHEAAVTELEDIKQLKELLYDLQIQLAFDDFGAGQGRLMELSEVPPDVLKFDMRLIRNIDRAPGTRQEMVATLVRLALDLGSIPLAEGVETEAEHLTCCQMGFHLGQGFLYGLPTVDGLQESKTEKL